MLNSTEMYSSLFDKVPKPSSSPYMLSLCSVRMEVTLQRPPDLRNMIDIDAVLELLSSLLAFDIYTLPWGKH